MNEVLHIKNFGPIKDVKLDLKKFNVLIGDNATGKSTVAKVLAICRYFSYIVENNLLTNNAFEQGLFEWGIGEYITRETSISYSNKDYNFNANALGFSLTHNVNNEVSSVHNLLGFKLELEPVSEKFKELLNDLKEIQPDYLKNEGRLMEYANMPPSFFQNNVSKVMDNPFYIPTERGLQSIFSLGKSSISNISDSLFNQFAKIDMINRNNKSEILIPPLEITYKNENGKGYIKKDKESTYYSLANAASGYQSAIPIVLIVEYYNEIRKKKKTFIIEEPELNLFPIRQNKLIQYFAERIVNLNSTVLLTTHSPYILSSINNLIYAYQIGMNDDSVSNIINRKNWVNPSDLSCYFFEDGESKSIIDEDGLIDASYIDSVSTELNNDFIRINEVKLKYELEQN